MTDPEAPGSSGYTALIGSVLGRVAEAGTWMTADERVAVAKLCRDPDAETGVRPEIAMAAARMAHEPTLITADWVAGLEQQGLGRVTMVEIMGVVSRQVAIDRFMFGVGAELTELPPPNPGQPTKAIVDRAKLQNGFLPTVGAASPRTAFTSVPADQVALEELCAGFYMPMEEMGDYSYVRDGVTRSQIELVAARTSFLNDCFY